MTASLTLRERKKEATRQALHEAVLRLAMERGLDAVTVDAIADEANVSRRTFSNYFANKEDALLYGDRARVDLLLEAVRSRPAGEPPWQALTMGAFARYADLDSIDPGWLAQVQLVRQHPLLLAQQFAMQAALEAALAVEIAARTPGPADPLRCQLMAATFLAALRTATTVWVERGGPGSLRDAVTTALGYARSRFE